MSLSEPVGLLYVAFSGVFVIPLVLKLHDLTKLLPHYTARHVDGSSEREAKTLAWYKHRCPNTFCER